MNNIFICPVCKQRGHALYLEERGKSLVCRNGHSFDVSSEGYINLALGKSGSGDSAEMCRARRSFLASDYYLPLAREISSTLTELCSQSEAKICDAGCGEGYYLRAIKSAFPFSTLVGLDLSKDSIRLAAKSERTEQKAISYAVAGIFDMPLPDNSFSALISVFAPVPYAEAYRILKDDGIMIVVHPGKKHLLGFKEHIYERAYENEEKELTFEGFEPVCEKQLEYTVRVKGEDIKSLFLMTPYYWKTSRADGEKLLTMSALDTELDFIISVYKKIP